MPDVLTHLASAQGRNDERPNVELAEELAASGDGASLAVLADALSTGSVAVQNDAIKVLYEIGARKPALVAPHTGAFLKLLGSKNNRNVWGALQAVESIAAERPADVAGALPAILAAADKGSVIAKDKAIGILVALAGSGRDTLDLLLERLANAAPNQFPMYAEQIAEVVDAPRRSRFRMVLETGLARLDAPAKRKRIERVLKRLGG